MGFNESHLTYSNSCDSLKAPTNRSHPIAIHVCRIDSILGLFCRISSLLQGSFAKETYRSHPIAIHVCSMASSTAVATAGSVTCDMSHSYDSFIWLIHL